MLLIIITIALILAILSFIYTEKTTPLLIIAVVFICLALLGQVYGIK